MNLRVVKRVTFIVLIVLIFILMFYLRSIIKPIFFSMILAYMLNPIIKYLTHRGLNKRIAVLITIVVLFAIIFFIALYVIPGLMKDLGAAINNISAYGDKISNYINDSWYKNMPKYLRDILDKNVLKVEGYAIKYLNEFFNQIIDFGMGLPTYILAPIFVYYFLIDVDFFLNILITLIPIKMRTKAMELGREIDKVIGGFIRSQIILSIIVTVFTFFILLIFKVKYCVAISIINGLANIIPYFGPVIGLFPAFLSALMESSNKAIIVIIALLIIQQLESSIIAPKLVGDSIGIHPFFIMLVLLIGGKFFGAWGLIFSIPAAGIIKVMWKYFVRSLY